MVRIRSWLTRVGYDQVQRAVRRTYRTTPLPRFDELEHLVRQVSEPLRSAFELLLLGRPVPLHQVARVLGDVLDDLVAVGLVEIDGEQASTAGLTLVSYHGLYIVASLHSDYPTMVGRRRSIYIGSDSYLLAESVPYQVSGLDALDVFSGCGIQALLLAARGARVTATDISGDAIAAEGFNAAMNGLSDQVVTVEGDKLEAVAGRRFDLVVANPPFVPAPRDIALPAYADGGEDGLRMIQPVLEALPEYLNPGGRAYFCLESLEDDSGLLGAAVLADVARRQVLAIDLVVTARSRIEDVLRARNEEAGREGFADYPELWRQFFEAHRASWYCFALARVTFGSGGLRVLETTASSG
jgi:methylase of polypeptide subunit release factors